MPIRTLSRRLLGAAATTVAVVAALSTLAAAPASAALTAPRPPVSFTTAPEQPAPYVGQLICDPAEKPGAQAVRALLRETYGVANTGGISRSCTQGGRSEHKEGRAYDWANDVSNATHKARADHFVAWATGPDSQGVPGGNAHRLGIQYVIWNKRIWNSRSGWKDYTGASPHTDHVHVSLSWDGAYKRTSWWTGTALTSHDYGPCEYYVGELPTSHTVRNTSPCPAPVPRPAPTPVPEEVRTLARRAAPTALSPLARTCRFMSTIVTAPARGTCASR
ncbi:hypothetical protein [Aquipuribacter sp. SD81]|uniref:hypothetical protein n=1 Tax=Aquipuribacter sp. SD81 TaxID=3127703 RepID=UPI00301A25C5